jgi:hypothetical protein
VYSGERANDPGDAALLAEALGDRRVFITKDHDIGALVYGDGCEHAGVILIDDLGDPSAEAALLTSVVEDHAAQLAGGAFLRVDASGRVRLGES